MKSIVNLVKINKKKVIAVLVAFIIALVTLNIKSKLNSMQTIQLRRGDLNTAVYGSAQLKTDKSFDLKVGISARIVEIKKSIGQRVSKGETLVVFDNLPSFKSPIDGVITALNYRNGETVFAQGNVLSIVQPNQFYLEMSLDQKSIRYIKEKQVARISFDGYRDLKLDGLVRSTFSNNGLFYAIIDLNSIDSSFLPGMSADVAIITEVRKNVLLAPLSAIKDGKILLMQSYPVEVPISVGNDDGTFAEVHAENISVGDLAIIRSTMATKTSPGNNGGNP